MCIPDSRYGLTLAWVTSENSTMLLESDILRLFFTGPYLVSSPLCSVSGVDCPSVLPRQLLLFASLLSSRNCLCCLPLCSPATNCLSWSPATNCLSWAPATNSPLSCPTTNSLSTGSRRQLSFASPYHFRVRRDFMSKNPFSGFAPKQTIESSALAAYPHSATAVLLLVSFWINMVLPLVFHLGLYALCSHLFISRANLSLMEVNLSNQKPYYHFTPCVM